jgi:hypothetical protein
MRLFRLHDYVSANAKEAAMPRCSGEGRVINTQSVDLKVRNEDGAEVVITLTDPWVFKLLNGEWHPDDGQGNLTDINTNVSLPAMTLVGERVQGGLGILYAPDSTTSQQRDIIRKMFGPTQVRTYINALNIPEVDPWLAFYCYFGLNQTGAVMAPGTSSEVKGGWAISVPDGTSTNGMVGGQVNLYPDSFTIIGGSYGSLFGNNRKLFFLDGVSTAGQFSQQVRSDFGFASDQGNAEITVTKPDTDWKVLVTP